jgi:CubicO group peptidase (beta-lactamase class C family)
MKFFPVLFLAIISVFLSACVQPDKELSAVQRAENYLSELDNIGFNGAVLVSVKGEPVISKGYGYSNLERQIKSSPKTVYDIGSITKQFTATAILKLEADRLVSTEDKITAYFQKVPQDKAGITIHDLLRHQSGLIANVGKDYEKIDKTEFLNKVFAAPLEFGPGTAFSYSNVGYSLLAMIIEQVSGKTYETYLYENLWHPAHMEMTGYTRPAFDTSLIAVGYSYDLAPWGKPTDKEWDGNAPYWHLLGNGGVLSTTEDMYKWHKALMGNTILSESTSAKLYKPVLREGENEDAIYAYGWDVSVTERKTRQVWHNGSNRIFYADFLRYIDEDVALILFTNQSHPNFNNGNFEISKILFNPGYQPEIPIADNPVNRSFTQKIITLIADSGLAKATVNFNQRSKSEQLLEFLMRNEGFDRLDAGQPGVALDIFKLNALAYPQSARALQGLAEGYMETGQDEAALKYFNQSLAINPNNGFVKEMIEKLKQNS